MKKIKIEKGGNSLKEEIVFLFDAVCEVLNRVYFFEEELKVIVAKEMFLFFDNYYANYDSLSKDEQDFFCEYLGIEKKVDADDIQYALEEWFPLIQDQLFVETKFVKEVNWLLQFWARVDYYNTFEFSMFGKRTSVSQSYYSILVQLTDKLKVRYKDRNFEKVDKALAEIKSYLSKNKGYITYASLLNTEDYYVVPFGTEYVSGSLVVYLYGVNKKGSKFYLSFDDISVDGKKMDLGLCPINQFQWNKKTNSMDVLGLEIPLSKKQKVYKISGKISLVNAYEEVLQESSEFLIKVWDGIGKCEIIDIPELVIGDLQIKKVLSYADFVIKSSIHKCIYQKHRIEEITAVVPMLCDNQVQYVEVPAGYCRTCNVYYIFDEFYKHLLSMGTILCQEYTRDEFLHRSRGGTYNFAEESILRKCGYTVNKQIGLGQDERQRILELLVDYDVVDKQKICNHLSFLINMRIENNIYSEAVEKWQKDMLHIGYYQSENKPKVYVKCIERLVKR